MESLLGTSYQVFFGVTVVIIGFAACVTGQAMANTWRPLSHVFLYSALLGFADRFLTFALFEGELLSLSGYLIDTAVLTIMSLIAFRVTKARKLVSQYPWLYEADGLFGWRRKGVGGD
ncbi:MAG: hypothetical protein QGI63_09345 [Rhodospirillales bacterium]|jgi:hypothetical protein|nr:hypothetical protein [Rhodospirillales bacterium]MDP6774464.1 hypothetical protein [Rhodospirillales bacterium]|tara:strand:+ start:273 stop:626 length:354 start_codon:yes stop_codon:yes gene_type:complete